MSSLKKQLVLIYFAFLKLSIVDCWSSRFHRVPPVNVLSNITKNVNTFQRNRIFEPSHEKTNNLSFRQCLIQTGLYSHKSRLEA